MGGNYNGTIERDGGRTETFEIAAVEQLIGCELYFFRDADTSRDYFNGVTWIKMKSSIKTTD